MDNNLTGSELAHTMLRNGDKNIWCAVGDESDQETMSYLSGNDFTAYIVEFKNGCFYCSGGMPWLHAVPIKIVPITQHELVY